MHCDYWRLDDHTNQLIIQIINYHNFYLAFIFIFKCFKVYCMNKQRYKEHHNIKWTWATVWRLRNLTLTFLRSTCQKQIHSYLRFWKTLLCQTLPKWFLFIENISNSLVHTYVYEGEMHIYNYVHLWIYIVKYYKISSFLHALEIEPDFAYSFMIWFFPSFFFFTYFEICPCWIDLFSSSPHWSFV